LREEEIPVEIPSGAPLWGEGYQDPHSYPFATALFWAVFHLRQLAAALDAEADQAVNSALGEIIDRFGLPMAPCRLCGTRNPQRLAHLHQDDWIGECCWTETLRASE
jgi:hypothetical protein